MSQTVDTSFIELYDSEVKAAYQRMSSLIRGTVRTRQQVGAKRIYFPILGKGTVTRKSRHADVVPMNLEHERVFADMEDAYAPEYIDELDQVKINWSLRRDYAMASAAALGRETDRLIIGAMENSSNETSAAAVNDSADTSLTLPVITTLGERLNNRDVPLDGQRYAVVSPQTHAELLRIEGATSSDFTTQQLLTNGGAPTGPGWMGFRWIMHSGLPEGVKGFFYHQSAVGHGIARDVTSKFDYVPQKVAWLVNSYMSMGAVLIDPDGVEILTA